MKTIAIYEAFDGSRFDDKERCEKYENTCRMIDSVMSVLPERPKDTNFSNGYGYIQHAQETFLEARKNLLTIACEVTNNHQWVVDALNDISIHPSWPGRIVSEYSNRYLNAAWYRFYCTDNNFREYGQPYYAEHPEKMDANIQLN